MSSMPPATPASAKPSNISWASDAIAWALEPQTRFTVMAGAWTGAPP